MKSKGFTLVELLAAICILAMIAAIGTPIIMNVINNNKRKAAEASIANIAHAADIYYYNNGGVSDTIFRCNNGVCSNGETALDIKGAIPESGQIRIDKEGNVLLHAVLIKGHYCYKYEEGYKCDKVSKETVSTTDNLITLANDLKALTNYKIYGNSVQDGIPTPESPVTINSVGDSTENLFVGDFKYVQMTSGYLRLLEDIPLPTTLKTDGTLGYGLGIEVEPNTKYTASILNDDEKLLRATIKTNSTQAGASNGRNTGQGKSITFTTGANETYVVLLISIPYEYQNQREVTFTGEEMVFLEKGGSVSENNTNQKAYKIPLKVMGKNIMKYDVSVGERMPLTIKNGNRNGNYATVAVNLPAGTKITASALVDATLAASDNNAITMTLNYVDGTSYTVQYWDGICNKVSKGNIGTSYTTVTAQKAVTSIDYRVHAFNSAGGTTIFSNAQIEIGDLSDYEPYNERIYNIYLDEPLRCVGDVCDYIDFQTGKLVRKTGNVLLNGSETWVNDHKTLTNTIAFYCIADIKSSKQHITTMVDKFQSVLHNSYVTNDEECFEAYGSEGEISNLGIRAFNIRIKKSRLSALNEIGIKDWLSNNNISVNYILSTPIEEDIELPNILVRGGYNNIMVDSQIKPSEFILDYYK